MRISVFGTGAVGAYFGGRLVEAGEPVAFVARGEALRALRDRGLRVASPEGDFTVHPVHAWQVPDAARAIAPALGPDTFVVPLQNGVEAPGELAAAIGPGRVLGGL